MDASQNRGVDARRRLRGVHLDRGAGLAAARFAAATRVSRRPQVVGDAAAQGIPRPPTQRNQVWQTDFSEFETSGGGIWRICAVIDYATKHCLAMTVTQPASGADALACLRLAVTEAERVLDLDNLRADSGLADMLGPAGEMLGMAPAPVAVVSDNGLCFRGEAFNTGFDGPHPLLRYVRTRVRSPQTNGVIERWFGTLKYEHLFRGVITDGDALDMEVYRFRII